MRLADVDVVFLSYREPRKEQFWNELRRVVPWARRVDGVCGFLNAFRRCAEMARSSHFLMIDGDTRLLSNFDCRLQLPSLNGDAVLTWASRNAINGLTYGNGSVKLWPTERLLAMTSSQGFRRLSGYFIDDIRYLRMPGVFSETSPNGSAEQAFVYGFRESLRLCVEGGLFESGAGSTPKQRLGGSQHLLQVLCGVGSDAENGIWANLGAVEAVDYSRRGAPHTIIGDYGSLSAAFAVAAERCRRQPARYCKRQIATLNADLALELFWLPPVESRSFKELQ